MDASDPILPGGGRAASVLRDVRWADTPLGPPEEWPAHWLAALHRALDAYLPACVALGPEHAFLCNDGFLPLRGAKPPAALGLPAGRAAGCAWEALAPLLERVRATGEPAASDDVLFHLERAGYIEETYFTIACDPVRDAAGQVDGVIAVAIDRTTRALATRRLDLLRTLITRTLRARTEAEACRLAAETLALWPRELPFALLYLLDAGGTKARFAAAAGLSSRPALTAPAVVELTGRAAGVDLWRIGRAAEEGATVEVGGVEGVLDPVLRDPSLTPRTVFAVPIADPAADRVAGVLVAGANRFRPSDESRALAELVASQLAAAIGNALASERSRRLPAEVAALDQAKVRFFENLGADLRTPLEAILGWVELLREQRLDRPGTALALELIEENAAGARRLVEDLVDAASLVTARLRVAHEPILTLAPLVERVVKWFRPAAAMKRTELSAAVHLDAGPIVGDRERLQQVVWHLVANALRAAPPHGRVQVRCARAGSVVELVVSDTGPGLAATDVPGVFDRWWRTGGTPPAAGGLGLSLAREIVELHGGTIEVESGRRGHGVTFRVRLPVATIAPQQSAAWAPSARESGPGDAAPREPQPPAAGAGYPAGLRILLVEDDAAAGTAMQRLLESHGHTVRLARSASDAEREGASSYDVLIVDLQLPDGSGLDLLPRLRVRAGEEGPKEAPPAIVMSGFGGSVDLDRCRSAGFTAHLVKPVTAGELLNVIGRVARPVGGPPAN